MQVQGTSFYRVAGLKTFFAVALAAFICLDPLSGYAQTGAAPEAAAPSPRALVHILDYIAADYEVAVADGQIISELEYAEMQGFSASASSLFQDLTASGVVPADAELSGIITELRASIENKADPEQVARLATSLREQIIVLSGLQVAPLQWPNRLNGQQLYAQLCVSCHGQDGFGDGPLAAGLEPAPTNFVEGDRIASISPFQAYNTIRMGVDGTGMAAYDMLSDKEIWDLAFYVKSLQAAEQHPSIAQENRADLDQIRGSVSLEQVATLSDAALAQALNASGVAQPATGMAALRLAEPDGKANTLGKAREYLQQALASYQNGNVSQARQEAIMAYLEGVEPAEPSLRAASPSIVVMLEQRMMAVRSLIEGEEPADEIERAVTLAQTTIDQADEVLQRDTGSPWFAFLVAASILLREGLEAFLIILAILGAIRATGHKTAARWVHGGWIAALALGIIAWFFSDLLIQMGAAQREIMEGGIALMAVVVLLYVGFWLHSKSEIRKWKEFIDVRVHTVLQGGNLWGVAGIAFFAVFREAFESVLFLSALTLEEGTGIKMAIGAGAIVAILAVLLLAAVALKYSAKLPLRSLFRYSSFMMGALSIVLVGKGLHAIQEAGLISITIAPISLRFDLLGVYPTVETLAAQSAILLLVVLLWTLPQRLAAPQAA